MSSHVQYMEIFATARALEELQQAEVLTGVQRNKLALANPEKAFS